MSWLGKGFREESQSLADAYASMYEKTDQLDEGIDDDLGVKEKVRKNAPKSGEANKGMTKKQMEKQADQLLSKKPNKVKASHKENLKSMGYNEEYVIEDAYSVSVEDGIALEEGKKKCKDGYEWDSDEGKCVKKKKKSSKTTIIIGRGYGGHHHHDDDDKDDGNEGNGGNGGGGDAGGGDGGGGGGE